MTLAEGIAALGLHLPGGTEARLSAFLALLEKWNRVYNLTAIRDPAQMVTHHLLDSLAILPYVANMKSMADVGSGGGLPGLTIAICRPDLQVASVEASQKKAAFQQQVKIDLGLDNVSIHCARIQQFSGSFDCVVSRAFAELGTFVRVAGHLSQRLLAMKGTFPTAELADLPKDWRLAETFKLTVPGLDAERHLLVLEKT